MNVYVLSHRYLFAAPRYWVRSRRHQGNSRRERED